jgi:hypothetical protein
MTNGEDKAKEILRSNQPEGISNAANNKAWSDRAKSNSFDQSASKAQSRHDLSGEGAAQDAKGDWSDTDWKQPQKRQEPQGWAKMDKVTASHTYTGKGGSKRD